MKAAVKEKIDAFFDKYVFNHWNAWYCAAVMIICIVICLCSLPNCKTIEYTGRSYDLYGQPEYVVYTDAVLKNRVSLDIDPSPELLALQNPYNPEGRDGKVMFLWDTAFYNGRYYCYFGIAPVFSTYLPFYFITHKMPENVTACLILAIYAVIFICLAMFELSKRLTPNAPPWMVAIGTFMMVLLSGTFVCLADSKMYMIPLLSGIAAGFAFLYFSMKAFHVKHKWAENLCFVLAGISFVAIVASRPSMALAFFAFLPIVIFDLFNRGTWKEWAVSLIYLGTPVVIGALLIMWWNAERFSGPFDFGNAYQLTVHDCTTYSMSLGMLPFAFIHYFTQGATYEGKFPLLKASYCYMDYGRYLYVDKSFGVFAYPATFLSFLTPIVYSLKKDLAKTVSYIIAPVLCVIVAWSDTCIGGVHYRYVYDILSVFSLPAIFGWIEIVGRSKGSMKKTMFGMGILLFVITAYVLLALVFTQDNDFLFHRPQI